jgi:hypothetical protein
VAEPGKPLLRAEKGGVFVGKNYFAAGEAEFLSFAVTFNAGTAAHAATLGIPAALVSANAEKVAAYSAAYYAAAAPNAGRLDREDRNEKRRDLAKTMRKIKRAYLDADPLDAVTPEILMDFGLAPKDATRTDVPDPVEVVPFTMENGPYLQVVVKHPARPAYYIGAVARYRTGGPPPVSHKELTEVRLLTRPRELFVFEDVQLGQTLYMALSWQNEKGRLGPPSPIQSHVIA